MESKSNSGDEVAFLRDALDAQGVLKYRPDAEPTDLRTRDSDGIHSADYPDYLIQDAVSIFLLAEGNEFERQMPLRQSLAGDHGVRFVEDGIIFDLYGALMAEYLCVPEEALHRPDDDLLGYRRLQEEHVRNGGKGAAIVSKLRTRKDAGGYDASWYPLPTEKKLMALYFLTQMRFEEAGFLLGKDLDTGALYSCLRAGRLIPWGTRKNGMHASLWKDLENLTDGMRCVAELLNEMRLEGSLGPFDNSKRRWRLSRSYGYLDIRRPEEPSCWDTPPDLVSR